MPTLAEISQARQIPLSAGIFRAVETEAPTLAAFDARTSTKTRFMSLALVGLPIASGFKDYGEGFTHGGASLAVREFDAKLIGARVEVENITAKRWDAEHPNAETTYFDLQSMSRIASEMRHLERVIYLGQSLDPKAFPGLKELTPFIADNLIELTEEPSDTDYVRSTIDAGGSTANTASSVYAVIHGEMDCQLVACNDGGGELFDVTEPRVESIAPDPNKPNAKLDHTVSQISGHFGVSVSGMNNAPGGVIPTQYSVRRLANLTPQAGFTLTDAMLELLSESHGDGKRPSRLYMSHRSGRQLADSRSATSVFLSLGGGGSAKNNTATIRAAKPNDWEGVPITYTSAISNTDAIETE